MTLGRKHTEPKIEAHSPVATSLVAATALNRRELLAVARLTIAQEIDNGVPAHALARLIAEFERIDTEIRAIDDLGDVEAPIVEDGPFDPSMV